VRLSLLNEERWEIALGAAQDLVDRPSVAG
jgi:hypothetical protein